MCRAIDDVSQSPNRPDNNSSNSLTLSTSSPRTASAVLLPGLDTLQVRLNTYFYYYKLRNILNYFFFLKQCSSFIVFSIPQWTTGPRHTTSSGFSPPATSGLPNKGPLPRRHLLSFHSHVPGHARNCISDPAAPTGACIQLGAPSPLSSSDRQHGLCCICTASINLTTHCQ